MTELVCEFDVQNVEKGNLIKLNYGITKQKFFQNDVTHVLFNANFDFNCEHKSTYLINELSKAILKFLSGAKKVLVVGLGNRDICSDSFGVKTASKIIATRNLVKTKTEVSVLTPSVFGLTGIESADLIKSVVATVKPTVVIVVDSLCAINYKNLANHFQLSNGGFAPGSGVGNNRKIINKNFIGARVITVGVPLVVYAKSFIETAVNSVMQTTMHSTKKHTDIAIFNKLLKFNFDGLVLTPKNIEQCVNKLSNIVSGAINLALNNYNLDDQNYILQRL